MHATQQQEPTQVAIRRRYPVAPEKVWRAWTDPQALSHWFGSGSPGSPSSADIDLRVGGGYRVAFVSPSGQSQEVSGVYEEVQPLRRLVFTWAWKSTPERVSRVSIELHPVTDTEGTGTELSLVHDRFFDDQARANHERGWLPMFDLLGRFLQPSPQEA
ncbi:MAG: SRPBCC domain-containing protein [Burkholderiales bacterium]|jgi:uncharacterized protein YndB with AHSA1/START domain|nr:SRPBCC domain-containing protein [Burkholderiales bacterium]